MPILFMPGPIHARPIHARNGRFMPVPIHAQICSGPLRPIRARTYSCRDLFMPLYSNKLYSTTYSCPIIFIIGTFHAQCDFFMSETIHARY